MEIYIKKLLKRRNIVQDILYLALLVTLPMLDTIYKKLNNSNVQVHNLVTDIDRSVPFVKEFIIPYVIWYAFIYAVLVFLCFKDRETYIKTLLAYEICIVISFVIYYLFQTKVPRPVLLGNDFVTNIVRWVYKSDNPFNCFPSTHCFSAYIILKGVNASKIKNKPVRFIIFSECILVMISTQFVKQHVVLDLVAAILLGEMAFKIVFKFSDEVLKIRKKKKSGCGQRSVYLKESGR